MESVIPVIMAVGVLIVFFIIIGAPGNGGLEKWIFMNIS